MKKCTAWKIKTILLRTIFQGKGLSGVKIDTTEMRTVYVTNKPNY